MSKALTVSIVIPVFNEESYIAACLDSIASQTKMPNEVLIIDNNSTDQTLAIVQKYPFAKVIHEPRQSVMYAHATGMSAAEGDIIGRIDADTVLNDHWVETVVSAFDDQEVPAVVGPNGHYDFVFPRAGLWLEDKFLRGALKLKYNFLFGCNMAIRRAVWAQLAPGLCYSSEVFEDMDLVAHMEETGLAPTYLPDMTVMVSARRVGDNPVEFLRYIHGHVRTARYHNKSLAGPMYSEALFLFFYLLAKPLHMCFDPIKRRPSLHKLVSPSNARPNPMALESDV